jgi:hypothetical protein
MFKFGNDDIEIKVTNGINDNNDNNNNDIDCI